MDICLNRTSDRISPYDKYFTMHTLRQTAVLRLVNIKFNINHLVAYLGHSSTRTTERYIKSEADQRLRMPETLEEAVA